MAPASRNMHPRAERIMCLVLLLDGRWAPGDLPVWSTNQGHLQYCLGVCHRLPDALLSTHTVAWAS